MVLDKNAVLFKRGVDGRLVSVETKLQGWGYDNKIVMLVPCNLGELNEYFSKVDERGKTTTEADLGLIKAHCAEPCFNDEELKALPWDFIQAVIGAILRLSGISIGGGEKK